MVGDAERGTATSVTEGALAGIGAYLVGYFVVYLWRAERIEEALGPVNLAADLFGADPVPAWKIVGWLYYGAHFVATRVEVGPFGPRFVNPVRAGEGSLELLYVVVPVVLLVAGFAVASRRSSLGTWGAGLAAGGTVAIGYLPGAAIGAILFRVGESGPDLVPAIAVAGVCYPLVFGSLGGLLAWGWRRGASADAE